MNRQILQICPHDGAPFNELCARYVQAAERLGAEVTTVFLAPAESSPLPYAQYLDADDLSDTRSLRRALRHLPQHTWSLVVCHRYRSYWAAVGTGLTAFPCVAVAHEFGLMARWQRRVNRAVFARRFVFAGVSTPVAAELEQLMGRAIVLPNVVDVEAAKNTLLTREQARAELGLDPEVVVVGVVGRLHYKKRPALAAKAFRAFRQSGAEAELVFIGDGDQQEVGAHAEAPDIHFAGQIANAARLMPGFDVLLHATQIEAFGMVVLEAMIAGVPVVALRQGGPEYVLGELGVYPAADSAADFALALQRAVSLDRQEYASLALRRVENNFSVDTLAASLEQVLGTKC